jgi:hypothetical protein
MAQEGHRLVLVFPEQVKMIEAMRTKGVRHDRRVSAILSSGRILFSLSIVALGVETFVRPGSLAGTLIDTYRFGLIFGPVLVACGVGLLFKRTMRTTAMILGGFLFLFALVFAVPKYVANPGNMSLRTQVFEPLAIATLACLLPGQCGFPRWLTRTSRFLLAVSMIVFGVDHFIGISFIETLVPFWIPWHSFWVALFGAGFIAAGLSIGLNLLLRWGGAGIGLMFAIWVFTLHMPRTLFGLYGGAGPHSPDEWSSLFIAIALWGGSWTLASNEQCQADRNVGEWGNP